MKKEGVIFATSKYIRISPHKANQVMALVRGANYIEAERILKFTNKKAAKLILKTLVSAGSNASNNKGLKKENLYLETATVDGGPLIKRARIVARSRTNPILKRTSHITIGLAEVK